MGSVGNVQSQAQVTIPPGGSNGQVLVKTGTADYSVGWQSVSSGAGSEWNVPVNSSYFYDQRWTPLSTPGGYYTAPTTTTFYQAVYVPFTGTIGTVGIFANAGSTVTINVALAQPWFNAGPGPLLKTASAACTGFTGVQGASVAQAVTPGWYWLCVGSSNWSSATLYYNAQQGYIRGPQPPNFAGPAVSAVWSAFCIDNANGSPVFGPSSPVYGTSGSGPMLVFNRTA